jgi:undecaprenyl diphosphate synthase
VNTLMTLLAEFLKLERQESKDSRVLVRGIGRINRIPQSTQDLLADMARDVPNPRMVLSLALSYGGQEEIVDGVKALAERVKRGELAVEDIDTQMIGSVLPSMDVGAPDLIVRTSGDQRISNFLLWGSAYAELVFTDVLWPDFTMKHFYDAIAEFQRRERRFGGVEAKVLAPAAQ